MTDNIEFIPRITCDPGSATLVESMGDEQRVVDAARVSIGGQKPKATDEKLLRYLWANGHTSPFEHVMLTFKIECPLFTARQIMRHRTFSYNEMSGRYSELDLGYYVPRVLYAQDSKNKQGVDEQGAMLDQMGLGATMANELRRVDSTYKSLLANGVSREQARLVLPVSVITSFFMSGNLLNWIKFLKLRHEDHAQYEVWWIATQILKVIKDNYPTIYDIVKEDIHGTERQLAESRHIARTLQEIRVSGPSGESDEDPPAHGEEVSKIIRFPTPAGSGKREA